MDTILIYHKDREGHQFAYNPKTNSGYCCAGDPLSYIERFLSTDEDDPDYYDIYSYIQYAEQLNHYTSGSLYFDHTALQSQSYEYW